MNLSALTVLACAFLLKTTNAERNPSHSRSLQDVIDKWFTPHATGTVSVVIVSPEDTEYFFAGELSAENPSLPNEHTLYEIGSVTKGFTGLLLADQILSGNISLNDTLSKLLTDWPGRFSAPSGKVHLLELATHSSGFAREPSNVLPVELPYNQFANYTLEKLYQWLDKAELVNPGSFLYSNGGAGTLGHALGVNRRTKFKHLLKERVLTPLGLRDTVFTLNSEQQSRLAPGHSEEGEEVPRWDFTDVLAGCGGLRSTVSDLGNFLRFATGITEKQKGLAEALKYATQPRKNAYVVFEPYLATIGLFWYQTTFPQETLFVSHLGDTPGYTTFVGWAPERQVGIAAVVSVRPATSIKNLGVNLLKTKLGL